MTYFRDEYIAPIATVTLGGRQYLPDRFRVVSSRLDPGDVATFILDNRDGDVSAVTGSPVSLSMGYREHGESDVFDGIVERAEAGTSTITVHARDIGTVRLVNTVIAPMAFETATPAMLLSYIVAQCGITLHVDTIPQLTPLPPRKCYVLCGQPGLAAVRAVLASWRLSWDLWCDMGGALYVGIPELTQRYLTPDRYMLEWGESIINMALPKGDSPGQVETVGLPIHHSTQIILATPEFSGIARVDRATWSQWPHSRTEVMWQPIA